MGILERAASVVFTVRRRGEFSESKVFGVCSGGIRKYPEHLRKPFFCSGGILFTQSTTWVLISCCFAHFISRREKSNTTGAKTALQEILLLEEIQV
jgi:hypothetical protein